MLASCLHFPRHGCNRSATRLAAQAALFAAEHLRRFGATCTLVLGVLGLASCSRQERVPTAEPARTPAQHLTALPSAATTAQPGVVDAGVPEPVAEAGQNPSDASAIAAPPSALQCLARLYGGRVVGGDLQIGAHLFPFEDGRVRTADDRFEEPDLHDIFRVAYTRNPIAPVVDPSEDPGRIRHEPLLRAVYGEDQYAIERQLVAFPFFGQAVRVHVKAVPAFERVRTRLEAAVASDPSLAKYFQRIGGTFNYRKIAGSFRTSAHAFGIAIDIAVTYSHYWQNERGKPHWKNSIPSSIVEAFEAEQFIWGGRWYHYDTMHFEYRPEFFTPDCIVKP
jgi:hypothetical protein